MILLGDVAARTETITVICRLCPRHAGCVLIDDWPSMIQICRCRTSSTWPRPNGDTGGKFAAVPATGTKSELFGPETPGATYEALHVLFSRRM
jgi:hypothetical protein